MCGSYRIYANLVCHLICRRIIYLSYLIAIRVRFGIDERSGVLRARVSRLKFQPAHALARSPLLLLLSPLITSLSGRPNCPQVPKRASGNYPLIRFLHRARARARAHGSLIWRASTKLFLLLARCQRKKCIAISIFAILGNFPSLPLMYQ